MIKTENTLLKKCSGCIFASAFLFFTFINSFSAYAAPRGAQELVPCGHWIYDSLMAVSLESRRVNFADSAPLSIQEIRLYLDEIDYNTLSDSGRSDYDRIVSYMNESNFSFGYGIFSIGVEPSLNIAGFYKTWGSIDWIYDRYQRKPALDVPITVTCGDYLTMSTDTYVGQSKGASLKNYYYSNVPISVDDIDINFPDTGYLSAGKMFGDKIGVGLQLGSGSKSVGRSLTGSMIWSEYLTGIAYAQIEAYCPVFKYTGNVSQFNVDKYFYTHQLDFRLFKILHLTAFEGMLVYAPLELRFLNPFTVYHGMAPWRDYDDTESDPESNTCAYLGLKFQVTPFKYTRFYGLFAMTQFQTPYERSNWSDSPTPDGMGAQLGVESFIPLKTGRLCFALEGSWANPYLYIKESPNWTLVRTYSDNSGDKEIFYEWVGSPFGPDTMSGEFKVGYEIPKKFSISLTYLFKASGEQSGTKVFDNMKAWDGTNLWGGSRRYFDASEKYTYVINQYGLYEKSYAANDYLAQWCYPNKNQHSNWKKMRDAITTTGTPEFTNRISVRGTVYPKDWLSITAQPGFVAVFNKDNVESRKRAGFEIALAVEIQFIKLWNK